MGLGTKATNLLKMKELGLNVPDFKVTSANEYLKYLDLDIIDAYFKAIDFSSSSSISKAEQKISEYLDRSIPQFDKQYEYQSVSVRSSTNMEDTSDFSFAGQFSTYLNVDNKNINTYVRECIKTMYSSSVLVYLNQKNLDIKALKMNVIVQKMITPESSGIIFSANPQGLLNELVIVCGAGSGDNVVEDKVDITTYYYNKTDKLIYSDSQSDAIKLDDQIISKLIDTTSILENAFGKYIDIEFCVKDNHVYLLQVRAITSISDDNPTILDNSNIVESYPGVCSPLTVSFATLAYTKVFTSLICDFLSVNPNEINHITEKMVGSNNGRMYYIISNWYQLLELLPFSSKIIPIWQDMLGVTNRQYTKGSYKLTFRKKLRRSINFIKLILTSNRKMQKLNSDFTAIKDYFDKEFTNELPTAELINIYQNLDELLSSWHVTLVNDMYAFIYTGLLQKYLQLIKVKNPELVANQLIRNESTLESMLPIIEISKIVEYVKANDLINELESISQKEASSYVQKRGSELSKLLYNYIDLYGDRYLAELKLENETFRTNNYLLIKAIIDYYNTNFEFADNKKYEIEIDSNFISAKVIKFLQKRAMIGIAHRETSRLNRSRIFGMMRTIFLQIGANLKAEGKINSKHDIFYLTTEEIISNTISQTIIDTRIKQNEMYELLPHYSRLVFAGDIYNKQHTNINGQNQLLSEGQIVGIPSSNGTVSGEVIVITELDGLTEIPHGKILVTKMTDPGWVFILTKSIAVISEKGSLLSHTAIISRELGIPAIVGAANVTSILKTGDYVTLNGTTGEIKVKGKDYV